MAGGRPAARGPGRRGEGSAVDAPWPRDSTHRVSLLREAGRRDFEGGSFHLAGDTACIPAGYGHAMLNTGTEDLEMVQTGDAGAFEEITLRHWMETAPRSLLSNTMAGGAPATLDRLQPAWRQGGGRRLRLAGGAEFPDPAPAAPRRGRAGPCPTPARGPPERTAHE